MTIVAGDILRTSMNFTLNDASLYQNVYHHQRTGIGILSNAAHVTAIELWAEAMYAEIEGAVDNQTVAALCSVDLVEFVDGQWTVVENIGTFTPAFVPDNVSDKIPNQVAPFVIFKTARPKSVGRKFLFSMCEDRYDNGVLSAGTVTNIVAFADDAINNIVIQVLDDLVPGIIRTGVDSFLPVNVAVVSNLTGSQRRRRLGVGA